LLTKDKEGKVPGQKLLERVGVWPTEQIQELTEMAEWWQRVQQAGEAEEIERTDGEFIDDPADLIPSTYH
jgi:hypothetical protein